MNFKCVDIAPGLGRGVIVERSRRKGWVADGGDWGEIELVLGMQQRRQHTLVSRI